MLDQYIPATGSRDFLHKNNLRSIKVIRKAQWLSLSTICTFGNKINDYDSLARACFPKLKNLWMYGVFEEEHNMFAQNCFPARLECSLLESFWILNSQLAADRSILKALQQKYQEAQIW